MRMPPNKNRSSWLIVYATALRLVPKRTWPRMSLAELNGDVAEIAIAKLRYAEAELMCAAELRKADAIMETELEAAKEAVALRRKELALIREEPPG
jgi:hypothetical protein